MQCVSRVPSLVVAMMMMIMMLMMVASSHAADMPTVHTPRVHNYVPPHVGDDFPLFDYVAKPDPNYAYFDTGIRMNKTAGWTGYVLNMTSQGWLTAADTNHPIWWHYLVVIVPDQVQFTKSSAVYVTGGDNSDSPPDASSEDIIVASFLACATKSVVSTLFQVPNQPIVFADDPEKQHRSEDAFVAFTWHEYMMHQDRPEWVDLLPMVKSVVRAMDTVTDFLTKHGIGTPSNFAIAGASKRGWTTWLTGAADTRVNAIMPIVMDMLNFEANVMHMYEAYGGWTFAFTDYYALNITNAFGTPNLTALAKIIDPLAYVNYLTMPKLVIDSTGDEFFMPDDDWYWWGKLEGETNRLMIHNAEHSMATGIPELLMGAQAFYLSILEGGSRPKFNWTIDAHTGAITVVADTQPSLVTMHGATTFDDVRRDFRLVKGNTQSDPCKFIPVHIFGNACINPVFWFGESLAPTSTANGQWTYVASQPLPASGWRGFFVELLFPGPGIFQYRLTTQVSIIPNTLPFPACNTLPAGCHGTLV